MAASLYPMATTHHQIHGFLAFLQARLSRQIAYWVFLSIVVIEIIILVPSVLRRERELLRYLEEVSTAHLQGLLHGIGETEGEARADAQAMIMALQPLETSEVVLGGTLYDQTGTVMATFGEPPTLAWQQGQQPQVNTHYDRWQQRYDASVSVDELGENYQLIVRHDATGVRREFFAFIGRITGLVIIISAFVTITTLYVLRRLLIDPVLQLRQDLLAAGTAISQGGHAPTLGLKTLTMVRQDELGDVITAFGQMLNQINQAVATQKQSETRFRTLVEQAVDAFFVVDRQGHIVDVNRTACHNLGYRREELLTRSVLDIQKALTPNDYEKIWQQLHPGKPQTREGWHQRKDGSGFPVEVRIGHLDANQQHYLLALARDITERKAAEKNQARLAEIGELAAMIVHEVRSPLTTILLGLSSFQTLDLSERSRRRLSLALDEAQRLQQLLEEILVYSREPVLEVEAICLQSLVQEVALTLEQSLSEGQKQLTVKPMLIGVVLWGDRNKLKQVLINILQNAIEACPQGEAVTVSLEQHSQGQVSLIIHNSGEPIPPELLPKLTTPFFTTKATGNGLGLAITQRIIEAHQGDLTITSGPDQGTTVTVTLPLGSRAKRHPDQGP
jgi:PAS domain S-box-containing protein